MIHHIVIAGYAVSAVSLLVMLAIPRTRRHMVRKAVEMYVALPGPHWVRIIIVAVVVGITQLIPGNADDWVLFAIIAAWLRLRSRRGRRQHPTSACGHSPARSAGAGTLPNADMVAEATYLALLARGL